MKRMFVFSIILLLGMAVGASAHPPKNVGVSFDKATKTVTAIIMHPVSNPATHYIFKIEVSINDNKVLEHKISFQDDNTEEKVSYTLPDVRVGDVITVKAYCNISGEAAASVTVE